MGDKYVSNADGKGWLIVKYPDGSTYPPLPWFLKLNFKETLQNRDHFMILEGHNKNREASVSRKSDGTSYLIDAAHRSAGIIRFSKSKQQLWYDTIGPVAATTDPSNPVSNGTFDLQIPDENHPLGTPYENQTPFAKTWFRIGNSGDRYLHPGRISAGCITVTDIPRWTEIYKYLIDRRKDNMSVGQVIVED